MNKSSLPKSPYALFANWYDEYSGSEFDKNVMALATSSTLAVPSVRFVLLKSFAEDVGFVFCTNANSKKGREITANQNVSAAFYWPKEKQVRIEGTAKRASDELSDECYYSRHVMSQAASACSHQSEILDEEQKFLDEIRSLVRSGNISRPKHWVAYSIKPEAFEFWIAGDYRINTRYKYTLVQDGLSWKIKMLYP